MTNTLKLMQAITDLVRGYSAKHTGIKCATHEQTEEVLSIVHAAGFKHVSTLAPVYDHLHIRLYPDGRYMRTNYMPTTAYPNIIQHAELTEKVKELVSDAGHD
jgi:hypothetical protein